jgi:2-amino-4-hydroxy-6-hydroxymethyldihydropteridine diphosphokinase
MGDRLSHLRAAVRALSASDRVVIEAASPVFETEAVTDEPQPAYLNAVLRLQTTLSPRALLDVCLAVELSLGRVRPPGQVQAPRTLDIDLLLYDQQIIADPGLTVPHPRLLKRPFVRIPLAHAATPGLRHPASGEPLDEAQLEVGIRRMAESLSGR